MEVEVFLGRVLHVIDPDNFWMHIGTNDHFAEFLQFEVNLEDFCRLSGNYIDDINEIYAGQFVLVDCTDNGGTWKRGQVSRVDSIQKCADVVYIDYGSTELVEESRLCANVPDEYLQFPFQALCCKLAGIQPIARSWTSRAIKMFQDMTVNQVFHTILLPSGPGWFKVVLYRQDGDERSIAHEMLAQELALPSGDALTEYFMDASEFYKQNLEVPYTEETSGWPMESSNQEQYGDDDENNDFFGNDEEGADGLEEESSPEIIPSFNFLQLHHTKEADTEKFQEKKLQQNRQQLEKENEKILKDFEEFANQASMAGYGGLDDLGNKEFSNNNNIVLKVDSEPPPTTPVKSEQLSADSPEFIPKSMSQQREVVLKDVPQMPLKRYSMMRARDKVNKMSLEDRLELCNVSVTRGPSKSGKDVIRQEFSTEIVPTMNGPVESESTADPSESESSLATSLSSLSNKQREPSPSVDKGLVGSPVEFKRRTKGRGRGRGSPRGSFSKDSDKLSEGNSSPLTVSSQETFEDAAEEKPKIKVTSLWRKNELGETSRVEGGRKDLPDFCQTLHKIFADSDKESSDLTRTKLQSLFQTDLYLFLNKEQMNDVIFTILNRAIRYYGEFHDILLEKIDTLQVTDDFVECFAQTLKTMEENYIKVQTRGKPFHVQCSKLIGHIFNMSIHWDCRNVIHEQICASLDKWILFNKKAQQIGQDLLQIIYLESFENVWDITRVTFSGLYPERKLCIQKECRDKILNGDITRKVRSQMLDIYVSRLIVPVDTVKMDVETQTELSSPTLVTKGTQTESAKLVEDPGPKKLKPKSSHIGKDQKEWPSLGQPKVPEWTNKILESCTSKLWNTKDELKVMGRTSELLRAPDSFSNSSSSNYSGLSSAFPSSCEEKDQSRSVSTTAPSRNYDSKGRKSADMLKTFNVKSPPRKPSPKVQGTKSDTQSNTSWSSDVTSSYKSAMSSISAHNSGITSRKANDNLSKSSSEFPPIASYSKSLTSFDSSAKHTKGSSDSFFPSAHIENEIPTRSKSSAERTLQDIGASLLSSNSQTSQSSKQEDVEPRVHSQRCEENQSIKGKLNEVESAKEKSFDWFDMEGEEDVPSHSSNQNYASAFSNDKDLEVRLSGDKDFDHKNVDEKDENLDSAEEDRLHAKTDSNSSAKVSDEVPKKESYDWFDLAPADSSQEASQNVKTSDTRSSNPSPKKDDAKKAIDWFDGGDNDEDTGNDAEWYTDDSSDDDEDIPDVVSIPRKPYVESMNEDDSESTDSFKTSARYNFPKNEAPRWVPGKRKCTICGEDSHTIYDCPDRNKKGFFF